MADRIAIMSDGRLQQVGTPREVYDAPANLFVAGFIGTPAMNTATASGAGRLPPASAPPPCRCCGHGRDHPTVTVGVRPEHLRLDPTGSVGASVRLVEWLGHEALLRLRIQRRRRLDLRLDQPARVRDRALRRSATRCAWRWSPSQVHLFDADTGVRMAPHGVGRRPRSTVPRRPHRRLRSDGLAGQGPARERR